MTETAGQRVRRYLLDGGDEDLKRLLGGAEALAETTRAALRRSGIAPGWNVIDCGCGPLGALVVMADLVGESGRVTGVDANPAAVQTARSVVGSLGLGNVRALVGDVYDLEPAAIGGPFDLAYTRLLLVHQADPASTLRHIAGLLRPGGWIIAQEPLRYVPPRSFPALPALDVYWKLLFELIEQFGGQPQAVERLPRSAAEAGLEVVRMDGSFTLGPASYLLLHAASLAATRERAVAAGLASGEEIDEGVSALRAAAGSEYDWVTTPFFLDLTLRKPA